MNLAEIVGHARSQGLEVTLDDLRQFGPLLRSQGQWVMPSALVDVVVDLARKQKPHRVLDPWARHGDLIVPVSAAVGPAVATAITVSRDDAEIGSYLSGVAKVTWLNQEPLDALSRDASEYDLVVAYPPFGARNGDPNVTIADVVVTDDYGNRIAAAALSKLSASGQGIVVLSPATIFAPRPSGLLRSLGRLDLHLNSLLHLPAGFFPQTSIETYVAVISRLETRDVFAGEIRDLKSHNESLLRNLASRAKGADLSLGALVEMDGFRGYRQYEADTAIARVAQRSGLSGTLLKNIAVEINLTKESEPSSFPERENAVYLPLIGKSKALASRTDLTLKAHNYAQIVIDSEKALAPYAASYYNAALGRLVRERSLTGAFIPKITKQSLLESLIYLPDLETQRRCIECDSRALNLISDVQSIRDAIWSQPIKVKSAYESLERVNREDSLKAWIDSLPFPLGSILWAYHASGEDDAERVVHLLHFFEALAEFTALVLWSAVRTSPVLVGHAKYPLGPGKPLQYSLEHSSFGSWIEMAGRLAKFCRGRLGDKDEAEDVFAAFQTRNREILELLFSSQIVGRMSDANSIRNRRAHGGIVSEDETKGNLVVLENLLAGLRQEVGNRWEEMPLLKAGANRLSSGIYHYDAELIMGRATLFERRRIEVTTPVDYGGLFLLANDSREPVILEPLIIITSSPKAAENACYFYNSARGKDLRFVSYHFRVQPEIIRADERVSSALEDIAAPPGGHDDQ